MKILITGGAGFIGVNLSETLLREGAEVYVLDNFYSSKKENIVRLESNPAFHAIEHDVAQPLLLAEKFDRIYHLGAADSARIAF